jgi:outer membrane protein TolC
VKAQEAETKAVAAEMRPNLFLTATLSGRAGGAPPSSGGIPTGSGFLPIVPNWDVGLVISIPIFDGVNDAREDAARAKEESARAVLDLRRQQEVAGIQQAFFAVRVAQAALPALERSVDAARINHTQADARFKGGFATSVEVADAENVLTQAEIELAIGRFELAKARAVFARAIAEGS